MSTVQPAHTMRSTRLWLRSRRAILVPLALAAVLLISVVTSLATGQIDLPLHEVLKAGVGVSSDGADFVVGQLRAPRAYTAALVGALLGVSGALLQSVARNPLASPDLLGVTAGGSAAAVTAIAVLGASDSLAIAPWAILGSLLTAALITALGWRGGIQPMRMVLAGIGIGFVATSIVTYMLTRLPEKVAGSAYLWTVGSTNARVWKHVVIAALALALIVPAAAWYQRRLRVMEMGDDLAAALGVNLVRVRLGAVALSGVAAGLATAVTGPIGFVALVAPAIARRLSASGGIVIGASALMGACLTSVADLIAREALSPTQLPIGLLTAAIGAPYLLVLLTRLRGSV
jgi:iron complex transport system permease protein